LSLVAACADSSGFAGDYEATALDREAGGCEGELVGEPVPARDGVFQLADEDTPNGLLVAYYACAELGRCDDLYDLARSFGREKGTDDGWAGYLSSAIPSTPCVLTHRIRRLSHTAGGVLIDEQMYRMTDDQLAGSACNDAVASERGPTMPCVEHSQLLAEPR
jgi:hypothetical protein